MLERLTVSLADRYRIERQLGQGGMATVYLAHDVRHDRKVALKVLRPELSAILGGERFLKEIRLTANLQHPHILALHDSGAADGLVYYVMPYVDGESLRDRLNREQQLPVEDAVRITREVAGALDYAHRHGAVHRDIKPENILLHDGSALVADFGIALAASRSDGSTRMTETGMSLGTPTYMAPEQAMGAREITPRADIYALGVVLYEMLVGEPPFTGPTAQAIVARVITEQPRSITLQRRTVPPQVEAVALRALEKLPADRFATAAQLGEALAGSGSSGFTTVTGAMSPRRGGRGSRALRTAAAVGVVALAAASGAGAWRAFGVHAARALPVVRFSLHYDRGTDPFGSIAVAPDGASVVYAGRDSTGVQRLFLRRLEREEPAMLPGTEDAMTPFFSPDGRWIAFAQAGKLRRMSLADGTILTVTDAANMWGGSWSARDTIVFSDGGRLVRVAAAGGQPSVVAGADTAAGIQGLHSPHFLPDGRTLLAVGFGSWADTRLFVVSLDGGRLTPLGIAGKSPHYVEGNQVVYVDRRGTVLTERFDRGALRTLGDPRTLAEGVQLAAYGGVARLSISPAGAMTWVSGSADARRQLVEVDRAGRVRPLAVPLDAYRYPRFSPDGRRLAMQIEGGTATGDIWTFDLASHRLTRLTFDSTNRNPEWTPDSRAIIHVSRRGDSTDLYRVPADGSGRSELYLHRARPVWESHITPDGRLLVFREDNPEGVRDLFLAPADSPDVARPLLATPFDERQIAVSPDGQWLAYVSNVTGGAEVYVRRLEAGSGAWRVTTSGGLEPRWGGQGRELMYRNADSVYAVPLQLGTDVQVGRARVLFNGRFTSSLFETHYDIAPGGQTLVFVQPVALPATAVLHVVLGALRP